MASGLTDVAVEMDGEKVITIENAGVDYSVFEIVSQGVVLNDIRLNKPVVQLERTREGWNLGRLVKEQEREKDREGPARPISIGEIGISDGHVTVDDRVGSSTIDIPDEIRALNASFKFAYQPVRFSIGVNRLAFAATGPEFALKNFSGDIAVADDGVPGRPSSCKPAKATSGSMGSWSSTPERRFSSSTSPPIGFPFLSSDESCLRWRATTCARRSNSPRMDGRIAWLCRSTRTWRKAMSPAP